METGECLYTLGRLVNSNGEYDALYGEFSSTLGRIVAWRVDTTVTFYVLTYTGGFGWSWIVFKKARVHRIGFYSESRRWLKSRHCCIVCSRVHRSTVEVGLYARRGQEYVGLGSTQRALGWLKSRHDAAHKESWPWKGAQDGSPPGQS